MSITQSFSFFLGVPAKPLQVCWLNSVFLGTFFSMHLFLTTIRSFSFFQLHLKVSETQCLLILMHSATESSLPQFPCRRWLTERVRFVSDSFLLKNSWYLCREHLTDFNILFVVGNGCGKKYGCSCGQ